MARQSAIPFSSSQYFIGNTRDQYITPATQAVLKHDSGDSFTVGARVRLFKKQATGNNDNHCLVSALNYGSNLGYAVYVGTNSAQLILISGNTTYGSSNGLITWGKWHTVVFRVSGTTLTGFVDGVLVWTQTIARVGATAGSAYFGDEGPGTGATARRLMGFANDFFSVRSALTDQQIADLSLRGSWPTVDVRYSLNDVSGSTAADSSGNGNNGTITGSTWSTTELFGKTRVASSNRRVIQDMKASLYFDGTSSHVSGLSTPVRAAGRPFAMGVWFKTTARNSSVHVMGVRNGSSAGDLYKFGWGSSSIGRMSFEYDPTGSGGTAAPTGYYNDNRWHQITGVYDGTDIINYIDGVEVARVTGKPNAAIDQTSFYMARRPDASSEFFPGWLAKAWVIDDSLTAAQVLSFYQSGVIPSGKTYFRRWDLDEGAGSTVYDLSGNGNNGTINSATFTLDVPSRKRKLVGGNLIYNGDFEYAPPTNIITNSATTNWIDGSAAGSTTNALFGWYYFGQVGTGGCKFDNTEFYSGTKSLKISTLAVGSQTQVSTSAGNFASISLNPIPLLPSTSYTYSFVMKTVANSGAANTGAQIQFKERNASGSNIATTSSTGVPTTTGWTRYTGTLTTNSASRFMTPQPTVVGNDGTATLIMDAWFDDITLVKN